METVQTTKEMSIKELFEFFNSLDNKEDYTFEIDSPDGFVPIKDVFASGMKPIWHSSLSNKKENGDQDTNDLELYSSAWLHLRNFNKSFLRRF